MNKNKSRQWVEEDMGWDAGGLNDAMTLLICENIEELKEVRWGASDEPSFFSLATAAATLWMLKRAGHYITCCDDPYHLFAGGLLWGLKLQKWADEKGIDLEAL